MRGMKKDLDWGSNRGHCFMVGILTLSPPSGYLVNKLFMMMMFPFLISPTKLGHLFLQLGQIAVDEHRSKPI